MEKPNLNESMQKDKMDCDGLWDADNLPLEITYTIVMVMFGVQAVFAAKKRKKKAFIFDITMIVGCAMPIGVWTE